MKLKCRIHEKEYDIVAGATFSEEYNETLDSGTIMIDHIPKIKDLKPYDDVYIWNADQNFYGWAKKGDIALAKDLGGKITTWFHTYFSTTQPNWHSYDGVFSASPLNDGTASFRLSGKVIDIWKFLMLYPNENNRWKINEITVRFTFQHNGSTYVGHYNLIPNPEDILLGKAIKMQKRHDTTSDTSGMPNTLYIPIELSEEIDGLILIGQAVVLENNQVQSTWNVTNITPPPNLGNFYYENMSVSNYLDMEFSGLDELQINQLQNLKLICWIKGERFELLCNMIYHSPESSTMPEHIEIRFATTKRAGDSRYDPYAYIEFKIPLVDESTNLYFMEDLMFKVNIYNGTFSGGYYRYDSHWVDWLENVGVMENAQTKITEDIVRRLLPNFYKHMLVDHFSCEMVDFDEEHKGKAINYKYKIDLFSETKRLEKIILPNISITQPIVGAKRTIRYYLEQFVNLYSPKIKKVDVNGQWYYENKYSIDSRTWGEARYNSNPYITVALVDIFDNTIFAPEMSLTAPSLRELLSRLMIVKDCIPIVINDVIYAMQISQDHGIFKTDRLHFSWINESMDSGNYSTAFRREYGGAISQRNSTHMVECLGFRCDEEVNLTLENMYLKTRFPIYKINHLYMCYYKSIGIINTTTGEQYSKLILVRQDIAPLVLQNTVRDTLVADWTKINLHGNLGNITIEQIRQYKMFTLGFDIGSNKITGWGEQYSYLADYLAWTEETYSFIESIMEVLDSKNPYGIGQEQFLKPEEEINHNDSLSWKNCMVTPLKDGLLNTNITTQLKSLFFEMDYIGMYSGAIIHTKENVEEDDIQTSDNCSSALSILEVDGLFEKEKINRLGNPEISMIARFNDVDEMNSNIHHDIIGAKWDQERDVIIYHREYQIYEDCVIANFAGTRDYIMKNYFTTVFAKYRTYSYASYSESITRAENDRYLLVLSDDSCYYEDIMQENGFANIQNILSAFNESQIDNETLKFVFPKQINVGYFKFNDGTLDVYFSDVNYFVAGYSLCFNIRMFDALTNGNYMSTLNCYKSVLGSASIGYYRGSAQGWWKLPVSENDGFIETIGCYFAHAEESHFVRNNVRWDANSQEAKDALYQSIFSLPKMSGFNPELKFGKMYNFCKDNKEILDFTMQYEVVNQDEDVVISEWLMKLTDFNNYEKASTQKKILDNSTYQDGIKVYYGTRDEGFNFGDFMLEGFGNPSSLGHRYTKQIMIRIQLANIEDIQNNACFSGACNKYAYHSSKTVSLGGNPQNDNYNNAVISTTNVYITLGKIQEVVRNGDDIRQLKIRAQFTNFNTTGTLEGIAGSGSNFSGGWSFDDASAGTITLTFDRRTSGEDGWLEFFWEGKEIPGASEYVQNTARLSIGNVEAENATPVSAGMLTEPRYYTFEPTMYVLYSNQKLEQSLIYAQSTTIPNNLTQIQLQPEGSPSGTFKDYFDLTSDNYGRPCIVVDTLKSIRNNFTGSIQYWYFDRHGDGFFHFVCGVNINNSDTENKKKVYISLLKRRNKKIYNALHRVVGEVANCANSENATKYGAQLYTETDGDE